MSGSQLSLGLVGCGFAGRIHAGRLLQSSDVRIVAVCEPNREHANNMRKYLSADTGQKVEVFAYLADMLADSLLDAVGIFTPHYLHAEQALTALESGCHVLIEKPLCLAAEDADGIVETAREKNRLVAVCHQMRAIPTFIRARQMLLSGQLGRTRFIHSVFSQQWVEAASESRRSWRFEPAMSGGGFMMDSGSHLVDAVLWMCGLSPLSVFAACDKARVGVDVDSSAIAQLEGGVRWNMLLSGQSPYWFRVDFCCERTILSVGPSFLKTCPAGAERPEYEETEVQEPWANPDANFIEALLGNEELICPAESCLDGIRLIEAFYRSAESGSPVPIEYPPEA